MNTQAEDLAPSHRFQPDTPASAGDALPDRWCFGLAHPYIQRLVFLAGAKECSPLVPLKTAPQQVGSSSYNRPPG